MHVWLSGMAKIVSKGYQIGSQVVSNVEEICKKCWVATVYNKLWR